MPEFDPHRSGSLTASFDNSRKIPPAEILEQIRHSYYVAAKIQGNDDPTIGGLRINMSGRTDMDVLNNSDNKKKRDHENFMLALMISNMTIRQMEDRLAEQYGENFAENLAAEHLDEDTYKRLMGIDDKTERRRQIAFELNKGIEDGSIVTDKIYGNSDFKDWLGAHKENRQLKLEASQNNYDSDSKLNPDTEVTGNEKSIEESHKNAQNTGLEVGFDAILGK
jgi:hypothetical protein